MEKFTKFLPWVLLVALFIVSSVLYVSSVHHEKTYMKTYQEEKDSLLIELTIAERNVEIYQDNIVQFVEDRAVSDEKKEELINKLKVMTERRDYYKLKLNEINKKVEHSVDSNGAATNSAILESIGD